MHLLQCAASACILLLQWLCVCDRDKKLYNHSYQLKEMQRFYRLELVPVSIRADGGRQTAYTINITGSKQNVTASKKYTCGQFETMQHGRFTSVDKVTCGQFVSVICLCLLPACC